MLRPDRGMLFSVILRNAPVRANRRCGTVLLENSVEIARYRRNSILFFMNLKYIIETDLKIRIRKDETNEKIYKLVSGHCNDFKCGHDTVIYNGFRIDGEHDLAAGF